MKRSLPLFTTWDEDHVFGLLNPGDMVVGPRSFRRSRYQSRV